MRLRTSLDAVIESGFNKRNAKYAVDKANKVFLEKFKKHWYMNRAKGQIGNRANDPNMDKKGFTSRTGEMLNSIKIKNRTGFSKKRAFSLEMSVVSTSEHIPIRNKRFEINKKKYHARTMSMDSWMSRNYASTLKPMLSEKYANIWSTAKATGVDTF